MACGVCHGKCNYMWTVRGIVLLIFQTAMLLASGLMVYGLSISGIIVLGSPVCGLGVDCYCYCFCYCHYHCYYYHHHHDYHYYHYYYYYYYYHHYHYYDDDDDDDDCDYDATTTSPVPPRQRRRLLRLPETTTKTYDDDYCEYSTIARVRLRLKMFKIVVLRATMTARKRMVAGILLISMTMRAKKKTGDR